MVNCFSLIGSLPADRAAGELLDQESESQCLNFSWNLSSNLSSNPSSDLLYGAIPGRPFTSIPRITHFHQTGAHMSILRAHMSTPQFSRKCLNRHPVSKSGTVARARRSISSAAVSIESQKVRIPLAERGGRIYQRWMASANCTRKSRRRTPHESTRFHAKT